MTSTPTGNPKYDNPERVEQKCANRQCRAVFHPRKVDVKRGWGRFCSKSCKAAVQTRLTGYAGPRDQPHPYDGDGGKFLGFESDIRPGLKE